MMQLPVLDAIQPFSPAAGPVAPSSPDGTAASDFAAALAQAQVASTPARPLPQTPILDRQPSTVDRQPSGADPGDLEASDASDASDAAEFAAPTLITLTPDVPAPAPIVAPLAPVVAAPLPLVVASPKAEMKSGSAHRVDAPMRDTTRLDPALQSRLEEVRKRMADAGHQVSVVETVRTQARQDWLFEQGRTRPGAEVTWTRNSRHTEGRAVDLKVEGTKSPAAYELLQQVAKDVGLRTLGARDPGHVELPAQLAAHSKAATRVTATDVAAKVSETVTAGRIAPAPAPAPVAHVAQIAHVAQLAQVAPVAHVITPTALQAPAEPTQAETSAPPADALSVRRDETRVGSDAPARAESRSTESDKRRATNQVRSILRAVRRAAGDAEQAPSMRTAVNTPAFAPAASSGGRSESMDRALDTFFQNVSSTRAVDRAVDVRDAAAPRQVRELLVALDGANGTTGADRIRVGVNPGGLLSAAIQTDSASMGRDLGRGLTDLASALANGGVSSSRVEVFARNDNARDQQHQQQNAARHEQRERQRNQRDARP